MMKVRLKTLCQCVREMDFDEDGLYKDPPPWIGIIIKDSPPNFDAPDLESFLGPPPITRRFIFSEENNGVYEYSEQPLD